ncbi:MAG: anti-sigma factor family protein [Bacteroidota bacterium]
MKCKEAYLRICDNLDADPNSTKCRQMLRHLEICPDCAALLASVKKTVSFYRSAPTPQIPATTHRKLIKTINIVWKSRTTKATGKRGKPHFA